MKRLLIWCLLLLLAACKVDDPSPAPLTPPPPTAKFYTVSTIVEVTEVMLCKNQSDGMRYEWRISNAPGVVITTVDYFFSSSVPGTYTITLTAFNGKNESTTTSKTILVGRRYIKEIRLTQLNFLQYTGAPWHTNGSGPNVYIAIDEYRTNVPLYRSSTVTNLQPAQLPVTWSLASANIDLARSKSFYIMDQYGSLQQPMDWWGFESATSRAEDRDATGGGSYVLTNTSRVSSMTVYYQVR